MNSLSQRLEHLAKKIEASGTLQNWLPYQPLKDLEHKNFQEAVLLAYHNRLLPLHLEKLRKVNYLSLHWFPLFFDSVESSWALPAQEKGLYKAVLSVYQYGAFNKEKIAHAYQMSALDFLAFYLSLHDLSAEQEEQFFYHLLQSLPGWSSFVRYYCLQHNTASPFEEMLALRCLWCWEHELHPYEVMSQQLPVGLKEAVIARLHDLSEGYESAQRQRVRHLLQSSPEKTTHIKSDAHFVFCIDVRSAPIRARLEAYSCYTTDGLAGFWGLDICVKNKDVSLVENRCPALLKPSQVLQRKSRVDSLSQLIFESIDNTRRISKKNTPISFIGVELVGLFHAAAHFFYSYASLIFKNKSQHMRREPQEIMSHLLHQISVDKRVQYARLFLESLSIDILPAYVVICGHLSESCNNIFESKLQCGACGNYSGSLNAQLMAAILNDPQTKAALGLSTPYVLDQTLFIAAEHETVTDSIRFPDLPMGLKNDERWLKIEHALQSAGQKNQQSRAHLPGLNRDECHEWSQLRPEWGLAGEQYLIIGPPSWAQHKEIEGQAFLHSYDPQKDDSGAHLQKILAGPGVVAYLLNMQYFFASFDPALFGAGDKMYHQLNMGCVAMSHNRSDLMIGLPVQSVMASNEQPYHQPSRLIIVLYAPITRVCHALSQTPRLFTLLQGQWLYLEIYDPEQQKWFSFEDIKTHQQIGAQQCCCC